MSSGVTEPVESELDAQIAECSRAISNNPKDAKAYRQRGLLKARMRRYDGALHDLDYRRAEDGDVTVDPRSPP